MTDTITKRERSRVMSLVRSKNTRPELLFRSVLQREGLRFSLHKKDLPGTPDIVLKKHKALVFVHGCFWHWHEGCKNARMPKSNQEYWRSKLERNAERFKNHQALLSEMGWRVFVLWECETKNLDNITELARKIRE